jgi:hypothetical protein
MQLAPNKSQLSCRPIDQSGNFAFDLGHVRALPPVVPIVASTGKGRWLARMLASRSVIAGGARYRAVDEDNARPSVH